MKILVARDSSPQVPSIGWSGSPTLTLANLPSDGLHVPGQLGRPSTPALEHFFQDLPDREGTVLANPDAARVMAVFTSGEMLKGHAEKFWADRDWQMDGTAAQGDCVC